MDDDRLVGSLQHERKQWLGIELRHLAALATVAEEGSFSAAALRLGYLQSAVSQQSGSLERIVGCRLLSRSARRHSVTATEPGQVLLDHVSEILEQLRVAKAEIDDVNGLPDSAVNFGVGSVFGSWLPASLVSALLPRAGWDRLERASSSELLQRVADGWLDAAFVPLPIAAGPFHALELAQLSHVLVAPAGSGAEAGGADAALDRWPLVAIEDGAGTATLRRTRPRVKSLHSVTGPEAALAVVRSGTAAAVMTAPEVPTDDPTVTVVPLPSIPDRVVGMAWHRGRGDSQAVADLGAAARSVFHVDAGPFKRASPHPRSSMDSLRPAPGALPRR